MQLTKQLPTGLLCLSIGLVVFRLPSADCRWSSWCPKRCRCYDTTVICRGKSLTQVPQDLPPFVRILDLSSNLITQLPAATFSTFPNMTTLYLRLNNISFIHPEAFINLTSLQVLSLQNNSLLTTSTIEQSILQVIPKQMPSLDRLYLDHIPFSLRKDSLRPLREASSLNFLGLSFNKDICNLPDGVFSGLTLETLDLEYSQCKDINPKAFVNLTLDKLILIGNRLPEIPNFEAFNETRSFRSSLLSLDLTGNSISMYSREAFKGFDSLQKLVLKDNIISSIPDDALLYSPQLKNLQLNNNRIKYIKSRAFVSTALKTLHLEDNEIQYKATNIFQQAINIEKIYIRQSSMKREKFGRLFQNLTNLRTLSVAGSSVFAVSDDTFKGLKNLRTLRLLNLDIVEINQSIFYGLDNLKELSLHDNSITILNKSSISPLLLDQLDSIDLSSNPFECTCELFWFLGWVRANPQKVISYDGRVPMYQCSSPPSMYNKRLSHLTLTAEKCLTRPLSPWLWLTLALCCAQATFSLLYSVIFRFRWPLKLSLFHLSNWFRPRRQRCQDRNRPFDVFISHDDGILGWVIDYLLPALENEESTPLKTRLFHRDSIAIGGVTKSSFLMDSIEQSRKTLLLVDNAFTRSEWCHFELTHAEHHIIETDNDSVVLAIMEDLEPINVTPRLRLLMKHRPALRWTEDPQGQRLFWERLWQELLSPSRSLMEEMPSSEQVRSLLDFTS